MELALPNIPLVFEVTYNSPSLPVAMSVYDTSGMSPVLVQGPTAMESVVANTYVGSFTAENNKTYLIFKAVYTDDTFATIDSSYGQGSESIVVESAGGGGSSDSSCMVIGQVLNSNTVVGYVQC